MKSIEQSEQQPDISEYLSLLKQAQQTLARHWLGEDFVIELLLASVIARGHVLVVDVPGVGKTTLAKSMAETHHERSRFVLVTGKWLYVDGNQESSETI
ncbi:MAG: hypothetical protein EXR84_01975 [Gammaproteobacteria bacterium]|nr:hypothetical protein [Gammaproteobacteria bacterium]